MAGAEEIPVPPLTTPLGTLPGVNELPVHPAMPDVLVLNDGTKVTTAAQWSQRRAEIRRILEYYAVGALPPPPGNVRGRVVSAQTVLGGTANYRLVHLTFGPEEKLSLDIGIFTPPGAGPFPAIILPGGTPPGATPLPRLPPGPGQGKGANALLTVGPGEAAGTSPDTAVLGATWNTTETTRRPGPDDADRAAARFKAALVRGYACVIFNHNDCGEDTTLRQADGSWAFRTTRFYPAYPGYDWGLLGGWAWGVSRIVDYLVTDPVIDQTQLIVSGVSRTGKAALVAGAFDDRIALTAPVVTGGGGIGAYRFSGEGRGGKEGLDDMMKKYPNWFSPHLHEFRGQADKLPFDQHWFIALMAPRAFLALEGTTDPVSLANAVRQSVLGAQPAFALLGAADRLGVNYAEHGHAFTPEDWTALMDFADAHLRGRQTGRRFDRFPAEASAATPAPAPAPAPLSVRPDLVVAADGSGDFRTIQSALASIPAGNRERRIILVRDGVYAEKIRIEAPCVTLRGESRAGTRIEFPQGADEFRRAEDPLGIGIVNLAPAASDFVLENLTVRNTHGVIGPHAFAVYGLADRTVIIDCDVLSQGADTLSLWRGRFEDAPVVAGRPGPRDGGRYYHARLNVCGSVDFICPRGWCYMADSTITQVNPGATAAIWHDGSKNQDMKFVLRHCRFDGPAGWILSRHHADAQFYLLDCTFSAAMRDKAPYRVIYPLNGTTPSAADLKRNQELDAINRWGERFYFFNSHRAGGDYPWHRDNLATAPGAPDPARITAAWTFGGTWDPERTDRPTVQAIAREGPRIEVTFSESVTVKGQPRLRLHAGGSAGYLSGSGDRTLLFAAADAATGPVDRIEPGDGAIIATEAGATLRPADLTLPR